MQKKEKEANPLLFSLVYNQVTNGTTYVPFSIVLVIVQYCLTYYIMHGLINPDDIKELHLPFKPIFFILIGLQIFFILLTFISNSFQILNSLWINLLLVLEASTIIYLQVALNCFGEEGWCGKSPNLYIPVILMMIVFTCIIYIRSMCYKPFHNSLDSLSMESSQVILFFYVYNCFLVLLVSQTIITNIDIIRQIVFFLSCILFWFFRNSPYSSPYLSKILYICSASLLWTASLIYFCPILEQYLQDDKKMNLEKNFWYYWGFSFPIIVIISYLHTSNYKKGFEFKYLFLEKHNQMSKQLFLQIDNLGSRIKVIRKSQLQIQSPQFRQLWSLIMHYNDNCNKADCPLMFLSTIKAERGNQLMELKKFTKTIQKTLQYGLQILNSLKNIYPNSLQLNLVIANYQLQVFYQKSKGIQLYNKEYFLPQRSKNQLWSLYYLKKKIDGFQVQKELKTNNANEQQIQIFKHDIQSSVSMLAQFWFFLSDPKCNLIKLYDLANELFPMKIKVDNNWKKVKASKNIECYNVYAKYLIKLFNDKETGLRILQQAQKIHYQQTQKQEISNGQSSSNEQHGVIFLQFDGKNSGIMYQVNTACQKIFGFGKGQLQGRKVNDIMPKLISVHHDKILQNYQQTNKPKMMNKQRVIWGRQKNGYLFPFVICIKPVRNYYSQTSQVYASIKRDLWVKQSAFLFTDTQFNISEVSSSFIGLFPELHGRIGLRKKVNISEYIKNFDQLKDEMISSNKSQTLIINREYTAIDGQKHTETLQFAYSVQQVRIQVSGLIGYYFKFAKGTGLSSASYQQKLSETMSLRQLNNQASNSYLRSRQDTYGFLPDIQDDNNNSHIVYQGGVLKKQGLNNSLVTSRIKNHMNKSYLESSDIDCNKKIINYGHQIRTKRLQGKGFIQIHELTQESEAYGQAEANNNLQEEISQKIKQSQLNSLLNRQKSNKYILLLKILTFLLLSVSSVFMIFQYLAVYNNESQLINRVNTLNSQYILQSQVIYSNMMANQYYYTNPQLNSTKLAVFKQEINQLDSFSHSVPLEFTEDVVYSDKSSQKAILSFFINKLISEFQLLLSSKNVTASNGNLFFVIYNSVNGILTGSDEVVESSKQSLFEFQKNILPKYISFISMTVGVLVSILIVKNIILNFVIKRKGQILNLFFEIPRSTCSSIQKQCEKFILKMNLENDQDEIINDQDDQDKHKKQGKHKKRTVVGEQKSTFKFIIASFIMLGFIMIFPIVIITLSIVNHENQQYLVTGSFNLLSFQKEFSQTRAFLDTFYFNANYTLNKVVPRPEITQQFETMKTLLTTFQSNLYFMGNILDSQYISQYNQLFFNNLCKNNISCAYEFDQHVGFNNILYKYFDYLVIKYQNHRDLSTNNMTSSMLYSSQIIRIQETFRVLFKKYSRQYYSILLSGCQRYVRKNLSILLTLMTIFCVINMTILLWAWFRFYTSLQEKIVATQYILTFIPIEQINKNPKIVKYLKQQILRSN